MKKCKNNFLIIAFSMMVLFWCMFVYAGGAVPITVPFPDAMKFYIRGDVGNAFFANGSTTIVAIPQGGLATIDSFAVYQPASALNFTSTLGLGWNINRYFRVDATWTTFKEQIRIDSNNFASVSLGTTRGRANVYLFNAYLNLSPLLHFSTQLNLYIGAGAGYSNNKLANIDNFVLNTAPPIFVTVDGASRQDFAWRAILGTAYQFTHSLLFNVEYSYISAGHFETSPIQTGGAPLIGVPKFKIIVNQITVGLIYLI